VACVEVADRRGQPSPFSTAAPARLPNWCYANAAHAVSAQKYPPIAFKLPWPTLVFHYFMLRQSPQILHRR